MVGAGLRFLDTNTASKATTTNMTAAAAIVVVETPASLVTDVVVCVVCVVGCVIGRILMNRVFPAKNETGGIVPSGIPVNKSDRKP